MFPGSLSTSEQAKAQFSIILETHIIQMQWIPAFDPLSWYELLFANEVCSSFVLIIL
jgi:hypothetical protein